MSETEPQESSNNTEKVLENLPHEQDAEGNEIKADIDWEKTENEFGSVEYKLYRNPNASERAILYIPGLGGTVQHFEQTFVNSLINQGYDVVIVCRNGTIVNPENKSAINSEERINLAKERHEDHLGTLPEYGYQEWTQEMACALTGLNDKYKEFQAIGLSFGGLVGLESIRALQEKRPDVLTKLSRFVSLSGQIGHPETDELGLRWPDRATGYGPETLPELLEAMKIYKGGVRMKDPSIVTQEFLTIIDRLYGETEFPESVTYATVCAEGDKYFSLKQGIDLWEKVSKDSGTVQVWHNRGEEKDPHGQKELTPKALIAILQNPKEDKRLKVIRPSSPLGLKKDKK